MHGMWSAEYQMPLNRAACARQWAWCTAHSAERMMQRAKCILSCQPFILSLALVLGSCDNLLSGCTRTRAGPLLPFPFPPCVFELGSVEQQLGCIADAQKSLANVVRKGCQMGAL